MRRLVAFAVVLLFAGLAWADVTVEITSVDPSDGVISDGECATIYWRIETTEGESGSYRVEIGGDGSPESGDLVESGNFSGSQTNGETEICADDLDQGDGEYDIYVIAVYGEGDEDYEFASTTITLDNPPQKPKGFSVSSGEKRLFLSWNEPEDRDIDRLHICYDTESHTGEDVRCDDYKGTGAKAGDSPIGLGYPGNDYILKGLENGTKYYVRIMFEDEGGKTGELSDEQSGTPTDVFGLAELTGEEGGCFVATALFGEDHFFTRTFRALRDRFLVRSELGRGFVRLYYRYGPELADYISGRPVARALAYASLALVGIVIAPAVGTVPAGGAVYAASALVLVFGAVIAIRRRRR